MNKNMLLAQITAENIIDIIRENQLKPGDRLCNETELAKRLQVGRSTVREAVKSMESVCQWAGDQMR